MMKRRDVLTGAVALAAGTIATSTYAMAGANNGSGTDKHGNHNAGPYAMLANVTSACIVSGNPCVAHCIVTIEHGDNELIGCLKLVEEMMIVCDATGTLAGRKSPRAKDLLSICRSTCVDCSKECMKHKKHEACKKSAEACDKVVEQIDNILKVA